MCVCVCVVLLQLSRYAASNFAEMYESALRHLPELSTWHFQQHFQCHRSFQFSLQIQSQANYSSRYMGLTQGCQTVQTKLMAVLALMRFHNSHESWPRHHRRLSPLNAVLEPKHMGAVRAGAPPSLSFGPKLTLLHAIAMPCSSPFFSPPTYSAVAHIAVLVSILFHPFLAFHPHLFFLSPSLISFIPCCFLVG